MDVPQQTRRVQVQGLAPARKAPGAEGTGPVVQPLATVPFKVGHGYDIHTLKPGGRMVLGGVVVSEEMSPVAHSDGDVVIHALVDAIMGAMAWGDIGEVFSDQDPATKNADSTTFLRATYDRLKNSGYRVSNVDITILAERPRLSPFKMQMRQTLRQLLGGSADVNIKAGTNEGCDAVGRGEAIAAHVVVLLAGEG